MDGLFALPCDLAEVLADFVLVRAGVEAVEELGALGYHGSRADGQVEARRQVELLVKRRVNGEIALNEGLDHPHPLRHSV